MDTTIRNLDGKAYRALKARAALAGVTVGEMMSEAIRAYVTRADALPKTRSLRDLVPEDYPEGNEQLSEQIDRVTYGISS
jgi:hypothetical protein